MQTKATGFVGLRLRHSVWVFVLLCVGTSGSIGAGAPETVPEVTSTVSEKAVIEMFTPPAISKPRSPRYPTHYQRRGREGWVSLSMMVDPAGKTYDVTVIDSSGGAAFEKNAVTAAKDFVFEAAEFGSTTIDASTRFDITFRLNEASAGTTKSFVRSYREVAKAIEADDREAADKGLETLSSITYSLYDQAYWQLARYQYEQKWGTPRGEYAALRRAAFLDKGQGFLPAEVVTSLLLSKLTLELSFSHFMRAQRTAEALLERDIERDVRDNLEETVAWIDNAVHSSGRVIVAGEIADSNYYSHSLLRPSFTFHNVEGDIAELRLHCSQGYYGFIYKSETVYTIEPVDQRCELIAIGTPGTTFELVETQPAL